MQQQFQQPEEKRYDAKKLQQVVELATRLQHEHHETLTTDQVEQMGLDLGLSPEFIRKALVLVEEEEAHTVGTLPITQTQQVYVASPAAVSTTKLAPLSQKTLKQAMIPALLYGLTTIVLAFIVSPLQRIYPNAAPAFLIGLLFLLPPGLALFAGGRQRSRRAGALGGLMVGLATWFGIVVTTLRNPLSHQNALETTVLVLFVLLPGGAFLGGIGALLRRWWDNRPVAEEDAHHRAR